MKTAAHLTQQEIKRYRAALKQREAQEDEALRTRKERAWALARRAAKLLKDSFGATKVVVFGSLVHDRTFTRWSDVDLAAWGLRPEDTFRAIGAVYDLDTEVKINLVDVNAAKPSILEAIQKDGIEI